MSNFGKYIRTLRLDKGMTQAGLAGHLHVTDKAVSKWERNLSYPDISLFPKLSEVLGISVGELLEHAFAGKESSKSDSYHDYFEQQNRLTRDIRTLIHIIIGSADLAEQFADDPARRHDYLDMIRVSGEYLLHKYESLQVNGFHHDIVRIDELTEYLESAVNQPSEKDRLEVAGENRKRIRPSDYDFSGKRILIAEDMQINRDILGELVKQTKAEIDFAENGAVCVETIESTPAGYYDLILMDVAMPEMDGIEATIRIRELPDPVKSRIPILAVTANAFEEDKKMAMDAGMNGHLAKPYDTLIMLDHMHELLGY